MNYMTYTKTTQVPNALFDIHLPNLSEAELKAFLVIIRQTLGWFDRRTGQRKVRDRITGFQFRRRTGMSKRILTKAVQSLCTKGLIRVTDFNGNELTTPLQRKGKTYIFYAVHFEALASAQNRPFAAHESDHNKTNYQKPTYPKARRQEAVHIGELIKERFNHTPSQ